MAATVARGALTQYSGDTPSALFLRNVPDWTKILKRTDTPFLNMIGRGDAQTNPMLKREWGWGSPDPTADTLNNAGATGTGATITVANGAYYSVGDIIKIEDELIQVTVIAANVLTVVRGFAGTTNVTHADLLPVYIIAPAIIENAVDPDSPVTQGEVDFNYHEIMTWTWQLSQRRKVTPTYETLGWGTTADKIELKKKMKFTAPVDLERALLFMQRALGSVTSPSSLGGLSQASYITTQNDMGSGTVPLTEFDLYNTMQTAYNLVGGDMVGKTIMTSMIGKRIFSSWYNPSRRYESKDDSAKVNFTEVDTDFGRLKLVHNYQLDAVAPATMYVFNPDDFKLCPYHSSTGWQTGMLATQGWFDKGFLRGDYTLVAENPDSRMLIKDFSVLPGDYPALA